MRMSLNVCIAQLSLKNEITHNWMTYFIFFPLDTGSILTKQSHVRNWYFVSHNHQEMDNMNMNLHEEETFDPFQWKNFTRWNAKVVWGLSWKLKHKLSVNMSSLLVMGTSTECCHGTVICASRNVQCVACSMQRHVRHALHNGLGWCQARNVKLYHSM